MLFPIARHASGRSGNRLLNRMMVRRSKSGRLLKPFIGPEVVEPVFARFEARDDGVTRISRMLAGMLPRGGIATAYVATLRTTPKVKPPSVRGRALNTSGSARLGRGIDSRFIR